MNVAFSPQVYSDIIGLVDILVAKDYISSYPYAVKYVDDLIDYIVAHIDTRPHKEAPVFFNKYGVNLQYITYNRNHNITWFILFECYPTEYVVKYITNNQYEGQYFNQ